MISAGTKPRKTGKRMKTSKSIFISKKDYYLQNLLVEEQSNQSFNQVVFWMDPLTITLL